MESVLISNGDLGKNFLNRYRSVTLFTEPFYHTELNPTKPATNNSNTISIHTDFRAVPLKL